MKKLTIIIVLLPLFAFSQLKDTIISKPEINYDLAFNNYKQSLNYKHTAYWSGLLLIGSGLYFNHEFNNDKLSSKMPYYWCLSVGITSFTTFNIFAYRNKSKMLKELKFK